MYSVFLLYFNFFLNVTRLKCEFYAKCIQIQKLFFCYFIWYVYIFKTFYSLALIESQFSVYFRHGRRTYWRGWIIYTLGEHFLISHGRKILCHCFLTFRYAYFLWMLYIYFHIFASTICCFLLLKSNMKFPLSEGNLDPVFI